MRPIIFCLLSYAVVFASPAVRKLPKIPVYFEAHPAGAGFIAHSAAHSVWFTDQDIRLELGGAQVRIQPIRTNPVIRVEAFDPAPGRSNYLLGNDPQRWRPNVRRFAKVAYREVYHGIDLVFYGTERQLEYDFVAEPGSDPAQIEMLFSGAAPLRIDKHGDLVLTTSAGEALLKKPVIYQNVDGKRRAVNGGYRLLARDRAGFTIAPHDPKQKLYIDPVLLYSTYLGGSQDDWVEAIAVDPHGNTYFTGETKSANLPAGPGGFPQSAAGNSDSFVTKVGPDGRVVYTTYLGGGSDDGAYGIAVDATGAVYVAGYTGSTNFPVVQGSYQTRNAGMTDAFVAKLRPDGGALVYSTYLGGAEVDTAFAIAIDDAGNAYVTGATGSNDFPVRNAVQATLKPGTCGLPDLISFPCSDVFVTKLNPSGAMLEYSTYLGSSHRGTGVNLQGDDLGIAIAADGEGNAYITGECFGDDFPVTPGSLTPPGGPNAFVVKLKPLGSLVFSSLIGGNDTSSGYSIALDANRNVYVHGVTAATDFPVTKGAAQTSYGGGTFDAFVLKLNASGTALLYSTYLGGSGSEDGGYGLAVDRTGNAYISGTTTSTNFPTTPDALQSTAAGGEDAFLVKLNPSGAKIVFSTYLGGSNDDEAMAVALHTSGNVFVTGVTWSLDFPTTSDALQSVFAGGADSFGLVIEGLSEAGSEPPLGLPSINAGGVVNAASSIPGAPVAPGSIAAVYGNFPFTSPAAATGVPWPTDLSGLSMQFGDMPVPLNYGSKGQMIVQVPWELAGQNRVALTATMHGQTSAAQTAAIAPFAPGIFAINSQGTGQGAILDSHSRLVDPSNPTAAGADLQIYCTGLGAVSHQPSSGSEAPSDPLAKTTTTPTVTIGGVRSLVTFSGLAPGMVGLYQVNARVAAGTPAGNAVPVVMSIGGATSNTVTIAIVKAQASNPAPTVKSISPSSAPAGSGPLTLTINGSGFIPASVVTFAGRSHAVSLVSGGQITITLSATDFASAGSFPIVVSNPAPGGGVSNTISFTVTAPATLTLTGAWQGTWRSSMYDINGSISADLIQSGTAWSGTISYTGSPCFTGGPISGTLTGSTISASADVGGGQTTSLSATVNASRTLISGNYTQQGGACNGDSGVFSITKSP